MVKERYTEISWNVAVKSQCWCFVRIVQPWTKGYYCNHQRRRMECPNRSVCSILKRTAGFASPPTHTLLHIHTHAHTLHFHFSQNDSCHTDKAVEWTLDWFWKLPTPTQLASLWALHTHPLRQTGGSEVQAVAQSHKSRPQHDCSSQAVYGKAQPYMAEDARGETRSGDVTASCRRGTWPHCDLFWGWEAGNSKWQLTVEWLEFPAPEPLLQHTADSSWSKI